MRLFALIVLTFLARYWTNLIFGKTPIQLKTIFLVGSTPKTDLSDEAEEYNDIYQWDFTEDLFNLTNKGTDK